MELHQLQCFMEVAQQGSFRAAAESLNKAQSAVSIAIKTLEENIGFPLFDRSQYRPKLTRQGQSFLPQVKLLMEQNQHLQNYSQFLQKGHEPRIVLGVTALWPASELVTVVQNFTLKFPLTEIIILPETLSADELLKQEKVDLSLGEIVNENQLFETRTLGKLRMIQVCSRQHPLAKFTAAIPPGEFLKHRQVVLKSTVPESNRIVGVEKGQPQIGVQDFSMKKELLLRGVGWGFMPVHLVKNELKAKRLVATRKQQLLVPVFLAWDKKRALGPCAQFLISALSTMKLDQ